MNQTFWQGVLATLKSIVASIESSLEKFGTEFWHIAQVVFSAEEQVIMAQLTNMLKNDVISLQNSQPGISSSQMEGILKTNAQSALASLGVQLAYTGIITAIGTAMHDLNVPDTTGNAGVVTTGTVSPA
jgi:hypothetical protein